MAFFWLLFAGLACGAVIAGEAERKGLDAVPSLLSDKAVASGPIPISKFKKSHDQEIDWASTGGIRPRPWKNSVVSLQQQSILARLSGRWRVQHLRLEDESIAKLNRIHTGQAVITVTMDGRLYMTAGCSRRSGSIQTGQASVDIKMNLEGPTRCHKSFMALERQIMERLNQSKSFALQVNSMAFRNAEGQETMVMQRVD